jgi:hypothetical protein
MRRPAQAGAAGWFQVVAAYPGNPDAGRVQGNGTDGEPLFEPGHNQQHAPGNGATQGAPAEPAIVEDPDGNPAGLMSPVDAELRHQPPTPPPSGT